MPSITTWSRLEPRTAGDDIARRLRRAGARSAVAAGAAVAGRRVPGEDAGTPIVARWRARVTPMTRFVAGPIPLEHPARRGAVRRRIASRWRRWSSAAARSSRRPSPGSTGCASRSRAGSTSCGCSSSRRLTSDYAEGFRSAVRRCRRSPTDQRAALDPETIAYADLVAGRALDGRRLRAALGDPANPRLDPRCTSRRATRPRSRAACRAWLAWSDALFNEPTPTDQTLAARPDGVHVLARRRGSATTSFGERTLTAQQYADGTLDWYSFDLNGDINMGTGQRRAGRRSSPAP